MKAIVDALPDSLRFGPEEIPTREKVRAMLSAMREAGYSMRGLAIHDELSSLGVWFAERWATEPQDVPPLLAEFARDMLPALGEGWESYVAPLESITPTWPTNKRECANRPEYARKYMLDTAKSAADLLLLWLVLRRIAQAGGEVSE
ncbi:hypothetical protein [Deinococcus sp. S9]|uniref:hypothetical protein n=1 Tax=Deinococcus sp. S9 TaxID=2545754 RepID=UPI0010558A96|nr:hypothetical protein [Deinococcus sp. S9]TDE85311.1 hypothetical protein E0686_12310 [Deinococcus sp. S9]